MLLSFLLVVLRQNLSMPASLDLSIKTRLVSHLYSYTQLYLLMLGPQVGTTMSVRVFAF